MLNLFVLLFFFCTIKLFYHGGQLKGTSYIKGKIAYYDYCDRDKVSRL